METKTFPFEIKLTDESPKSVFVNGIEYIQAPKPEIKNPEWDDFGRVNGYYINACSDISALTKSNISDKSNRNTWPTKEEAEAALALSQLLQWRNKYNGDYLFDVGSHYAIANFGDHFQVKLFSAPYPLRFKDKETATKFLNDFYELLEIAKPLL